MPTPMTQQDSQALWAGAFQQAHASADPPAETADALWSHAFASARGERPPIDTTDPLQVLWANANARVTRRDGQPMPRPIQAAGAVRALQPKATVPAVPLMPSAEGQDLWKAAFARQGRERVSTVFRPPIGLGVEARHMSDVTNISPPAFRLANKLQVSEFFDVSVKTVDLWVRRGCPFIQRGDLRTPWIFDLLTVSEWRYAPPTRVRVDDPEKLKPTGPQATGTRARRSEKKSMR
jgi:hypothetical protein